MMKKSTEVQCPDCKSIVSSSQLKEHVVMCKSYVAKLLPNTIKIADYLTKDYLQFLVAELDIAKERIVGKLCEDQQPVQNFASYQSVQLNEQIIKNYQQEKAKIEIEQETKGKPQENQKEMINKQREFIKSTSQEQRIQNNSIVVCGNCQKRMDGNDMNLFTYIYTCCHLICMDCLKSYINDQFVQKKGSLKCLVKGCKSEILGDQIKQLLGNDDYDKMETQILRRTLSFIRCWKCNHEYQFNEGNANDAPKVNESGKKLTKAQMEHYAKNRFVCPNSSCRQEQCKICHAIPYHLGKTCEENEQFKNAKKCRYCNDVLKKGYTSNLGITAFNDICPKKQCQKMSKMACSKIHPCKHSCFGFIRQSKCLPCLNQKCALKEKVKHDQNEDSYCSICYIEGLKTGPCVMSKCGHIFHYSCLQKRLQIRWHTPRILFGFCYCPLCKQWIQLPSECPLAAQLNKYKELYENIRQKAINRLKFEKLQNDSKIKDPKSNFYNKPNDYAMAIYAYFECFKCKKPYFGGRKNCMEMMNEQSNAGSTQKFEAEKLICPQCCPVQTKDCPKHGKEFVAFKCKFCCNIGMWFCWGSTHFCDDCHKRQQKGQYISKIPKQKLPKCQGEQRCPSGGNHGENGNQFSLGCLLCKNYKEAAQKF